MRYFLRLLIILIIPNLAFAHSFFEANGKRVLDVKRSSFENGSDILLYSSFGNANQNFIYEKQQIKLATRKEFCLDISRNKNFKYSQVILWKCNGNNNQKFTISNGFIYPHDNPLQCLTYSSAGALSATECKRAANQKFYIPKVCLYKEKDYKGAVTCINESKEVVEYNDTASSVSVVNTVARLYDAASYKGKSRRVDRNVSWLGGGFNDITSSVKIPTERTFLITSDPQLVCSKNCGVSAAQSQKNIKQQYQFFAKKYPDVDAVIINGDETEFGHQDEWAKFESMTSYLDGLPFYYGLGNHDIFNNLNDCYENNCAIRSIRKLKDHVRSKDNVYSFDMLYSRGYVFPTERDTYKGSFSYSLDFGDVLVIQLNDYEKKHNPLKINQYSSLTENLGGNDTRRYVIDRFQDAEYAWLENQLEQAEAKNQIVIVNQHRDDADAGKLRAVLNIHKVKLRFSGHYHYKVAKNNNRFFSSGSSARGDYLKLTIDSQKRTAEVYKYKNGSTPQGEEELMEKMTFAEKKSPTAFTTAPIRIKVKNSGAYISKVTIRWVDRNGFKYNAVSPDLLVGNVFYYTIPGGGKAQEIVSKTLTGLVWEPTRNIFSIKNRTTDFCANTWGTTLHPSWAETDCN